MSDGNELYQLEDQENTGTLDEDEDKTFDNKVNKSASIFAFEDDNKADAPDLYSILTETKQNKNINLASNKKTVELYGRFKKAVKNKVDRSK